MKRQADCAGSDVYPDASQRSDTAVPEVSTAVRMPVNLLVVFLTLGTGAIDAVAILALGEAFASVMTGNLVFAGLAAGTWSSDILAHVSAAVFGYIVGGGLASFAANRMRKTGEAAIWPFRVTFLLTGQLFLILGLAIWWLSRGGDLSGAAEVAVLAVAAGAMGIQGAAVRGIGVAVSTTYMTGALTTLVECIVTRRAFSATEKAALGGLLSLVTGAAAGGYIASAWLPMAFLFPAATLGGVVVACGIVHIRRHRRRRRAG